MTNWRTYRRYPQEHVVTVGADLLAFLAARKPGMDTVDKVKATARLRRLATSLRAMHRTLLLPESSSRQLVIERFEQAAQAVSEYQSWVALEQPTTIAALSTAVRKIVIAILTGFYHDLPQPQDASANRLSVSRVRAALHISQQLAIGVLPITMIVTLPTLGVTLPESVRQWVTGLGIVWLLARLIALLGPAGSVTLKDAQELIRATGGSSLVGDTRRN